MTLNIRLATHQDELVISDLIKLSSRKLALGDYSKEQIEGALSAAWGLDTQLLKDQTYFIVEQGQDLAGCGGWSFRETLFGSDQEANRSAKRLEPSRGAAKIRAFFVHPDFARKGVGSLIMQNCEQAARAYGFRKMELMSTLPGLKFYQHHGFIPGETVDYPVGEGISIDFIPMHKHLD